jgi:putative peptide zinc metalloprotease protein
VRWASLAALGLLAGLLLVPLPYRIVAPAVVQPREAQRVYVTVPGRLERCVSPGTAVAAGQELASLVNLELRREVVELAGQCTVQRRHLASLRARQGDDPAAAAQIPGAEADLEDLEGRLRQRQEDEERLVLRAPAAGTVIPPPREPPSFYRPGELPAAHGTPLDARAQGGYLAVGALLCLVGDPADLEALVVIDQSQMQFVGPDQSVRLRLDASPGQILRGRIVELARLDLKVAPRELAEHSELLVHFDREGIPRPAVPSYQARVALDEGHPPLPIGTRGLAKISVAPQPLGLRLYRAARSLFSFGV